VEDASASDQSTVASMKARWRVIFSLVIRDGRFSHSPDFTEGRAG
jgi:hypothetical protein